MDKGIQEDGTPLHASRPSTPRHSPPLFSPPGSPPSPPSPDSNQSNAGRSSPVGEPFPVAHYPKICTALRFIDRVRSANLVSQFDPEELQELLDPQEHATTPLDDPSLRLSRLNYISLMGSSRDTYEAVCQNIQECIPDTELLSYYQVDRRAKNLSRLISWEHHMCINSCVGFTGPYAHLEQCPKCGKF